ncbi:cytochrome d ubiquinol oxidase subunit II [Usitatibacter palustris]|uniref:Cytochrome bd-I ubiquinol oxidase subunit 2 n=1 Tax=Usitatibacter palustris TaxID=2732487 RepID=A0A6M4H690_9PROT|nr:cytochrome d ubiquinol oxidase subunit II [Usitatibacter palustris]QJR13984.1 Cytochrome bd-I ubiquinol oxidase subunit 2 [Usitatibacter palustris]
MDILPLVFFFIMGLAVLVYVVLDGFDLGVGMLMPAATEKEQSVMVSSIGPFWDANETWLVLGVGVLLIAFPVAHGVVLQSLYLLAVAMLIGIMLRGVAFEFRMKAQGWHRELWNWLFWAGSFIASFFQGAMLGRYITGFESGFFYLAFAVLCGASVCGGYVLLGATWLIGKTEGPLQKKSFAWARWGLLWVAFAIALVSAATPLVSETVRDKWFDFPRTLFVMVLPIGCGLAWLWTWREVGRLEGGSKASHWRPFMGTVVVFVLAMMGLAYSLFPYVVIDRLTLWEAAAHPTALRFTFIGTAIVLPFIIGYTIVSYRIFGGKAKAGLYD